MHLIAGAIFSISSGSCFLSDDGTCFNSPNYPSDYDNYGNCTIGVLGQTQLSVTAFSTESGFDRLTVAGIQYEGYVGPGDVLVNIGDSVSWYSDGSVTRSGFKICAGELVSPSFHDRPIQHGIACSPNSLLTLVKITVEPSPVGAGCAPPPLLRPNRWRCWLGRARKVIDP